MSKSNKQAKKRLIRLFGRTDMFVAARVAESLEALGITSYKVFERQKRYKGKPISQQLTFHHLKHRSEGGDRSVENGALIGDTHHQYLHSLDRNEEEIANNLIREWKMNFLIMNGKGELQDSGQFIPDFSDYITIPVFDGPPPKKEIDKRKRTRAQEKRELQDLIDEYYAEQDEFEK